MSDVKRVTLTTIGDVVKKGGGGGGPFGALSGFDSTPAFNPFGGGSAPFGAPMGTGKDATGTGSKGVEGGAEGSNGASSGAKKPKTVRLELNLFEPTADSFPEFNYSKLAHDEQKRLKKAQKKQQEETNGFLSDPEPDNHFARMARELEQKYGTGSDYASKGKPARPSKLDYYDRGAGYDEEDSFIDNSEAYDELIPQEIETVGGGFYINSGQLEFKQLSNFERPEDAQRMPKPKKRALSTTSESSDDDELANAGKKAEESAQNPQSQKQSQDKSSANADHQQQMLPEEGANDAVDAGTTEAMLSDEKSRMNGHVAKKQKLLENGQLPPKVNNEMDKSKLPTADSKDKANDVKAKTASSSPTLGAVHVPGDGEGKKDETDAAGVKMVKTTTVKDMLRAKRDSLRKMEQEKKGRSSGSSRVSSSEAEEDGDGGGDEEDEDEENDEDDDEDDEDEEYDEEEGVEGSDKNSNESGSEVDIVSESESSRESANEKEASARGKVVQPINSTPNGGIGDNAVRPSVVVTDAAQQAKDRKQKDCKLPDDLPEQLRKDVESLKELARGQTGKLNYFDSKVADLLVQIDERARTTSGSSTRNAVFRHLEAQLSISRQSLQLKLKKIRIRKVESKSKSLLSRLEDVVVNMMPNVGAKYELECLKVMEMRTAAASQAAGTAGSLANGERSDAPNPSSQIRNPKKKFPWNDRSRDMLWELYNTRLQLFGLLRPRNQTEDECVAEYMRGKVVPLWPKGWMRYEDLHKELDRRKKALAKSQGAVTVSGARDGGKKVSPPHASPGTAIDPSLIGCGMGAVNGVKPTETVGPPSRSATPSSIKSGGSGKGGEGERTPSDGNNMHHSTPGSNAIHHSPAQPGPSISPSFPFKRTSDHSIINIMNSPPPPQSGEKQPGDLRHRSFDGADQAQPCAFPNPDVQTTYKRLPAAPAAASTNNSKAQLPSSDRQPWNTREDDSDSSIEIIAEYNVSGAAQTSVGSVGKVATSTSMVQSTPPVPGTTNLPVLNKEKYKNIILGKNKGHTGSNSSAGSSPVLMGDAMSTMGAARYSKSSPTINSASVSSTPGVIGFATPSGVVSAGGGMTLQDVLNAGGSVRLKDTPPPLDMDVQQIMKDLKEFEELQKRHKVDSGRKSDSTSQQQPQQQQQQQHDAAASGPSAADYFIDCDIDADDLLFATDFAFGAHNN